MDNTVFITEASNKFWGMAEDLKRSIHKFYPKNEVIIHPYTDTHCVSLQDEDYQFSKDPGMSYNFLLPYFIKYNRVIFFNGDILMVGECPDLFKDYEFGMTVNNINI